MTPLVDRGGFLLVLVRDIALPCTGNNALLRPSAAAPLRSAPLHSEPARSPGEQEGREAGSKRGEGYEANDGGNRLGEGDKAKGKREVERERIGRGRLMTHIRSWTLSRAQLAYFV